MSLGAKIPSMEASSQVRWDGKKEVVGWFTNTDDFLNKTDGRKRSTLAPLNTTTVKGASNKKPKNKKKQKKKANTEAEKNKQLATSIPTKKNRSTHVQLDQQEVVLKPQTLNSSKVQQQSNISALNSIIKSTTSTVSYSNMDDDDFYKDR